MWNTFISNIHLTVTQWAYTLLHLLVCLQIADDNTDESKQCMSHLWLGMTTASLTMQLTTNVVVFELVQKVDTQRKCCVNKLLKYTLNKWSRNISSFCQTQQRFSHFICSPLDKLKPSTYQECCDNMLKVRWKPLPAVVKISSQRRKTNHFNKLKRVKI